MQPLKFIDVFAGCGGLSLGLLKAGWTGQFAIEKSPLAFQTLKHNLVDGTRHSFDWPDWLPKQAMTCEELLASHDVQLGELTGKVDLIVGGPPCQGFSIAGKRNPDDPRNKMTEQYLALIGLVKPRFLVIENVAGYNMKFEKSIPGSLVVGESEAVSYAEYIALRLEELGYSVSSGLANCADFGVPQNRRRYLIICERNDLKEALPDLYQNLIESRIGFLKSKKLGTKKIGAKEAISDLEVAGRTLVENKESAQSNFFEPEYRFPASYTEYQNLMRDSEAALVPNSRRLPRHRPATVENFKRIMSICTPGRSVTPEQMKILGTKKHSTTVLHPSMPAPTITTLPDDILHYCEPRILTVRETARLQSFPDWFAFQGKYTTGGKSRKQECPRYTQVGNAVPPLLAEAIGKVLISRMDAINKCQPEQTVNEA